VATTRVEAFPSTIDPQAVLFRIHEKVGKHLSQLPNYTCHEVINRFIQPVNATVLRQYDEVELEVAFVGYRELFARPGDTHFQEQPITALVRSGTIGNGVFGSIVTSVFLGGVASFDYVGVSAGDGHKTYRFDFQVTQEKSRFSVKHNYTEAIVAYRGSFWADAETYDLVRIEITADQMPAEIGVVSIKEKVQYAALRIRDSEFLLPLRGETNTLDSSGTFTRNDLTLEQCREFTGESSVTFGGPLVVPSTGQGTPRP
jgi:hypothetical protein